MATLNQGVLEQVSTTQGIGAKKSQQAVLEGIELTQQEPATPQSVEYWGESLS
jgi:hypothetical protein